MSSSNSKKTNKSNKVKEEPGVYDIPERYEIIDGIRYDFLSSPRFAHQKILTNLLLGFHSNCQTDGEVLVAPLDVHFDEENILQPDVIYISNENLSIIRDGFIFGSPDLVVEILSPSTGQRDKTIKKATYEKFGVKEYWLVDPAYRIVEQFVMQDGKYDLFTTLTESSSIHSPIIPCLTINLSTTFPENYHD